MFPTARTPLPDRQTEVSGQNRVTTSFDPEARGYYPYCALIQDENGDFHLVEGNSPPEVIIQ